MSSTRAARKPDLHQPRSKPAGRSAPAKIRIIGGLWKRTPLPVLDAEGLRPTTDRVRETVFNWLNHQFDGSWSGRRVLDLFAGSGGLGFEAASRGAQSVLMIEKSAPLARSLQAVAAKLQAEQVEIRCADALRTLEQLPGGYDCIFLDPPYALDLLPRLLPQCASLLAPKGLVYAESDQPFEPAPEWMSGWDVVRSDRAGRLHYCLLRCTKLA